MMVIDSRIIANNNFSIVLVLAICNIDKFIDSYPDKVIYSPFITSHNN